VILKPTLLASVVVDLTIKFLLQFLYPRYYRPNQQVQNVQTNNRPILKLNSVTEFGSAL